MLVHLVAQIGNRPSPAVAAMRAKAVAVEHHCMNSATLVAKKKQVFGTVLDSVV